MVITSTNPIRPAVVAAIACALGCSGASAAGPTAPAPAAAPAGEDPRAAQLKQEKLAELEKTEFRCEPHPGMVSVVVYMNGQRADVVANGGSWSVTDRYVTVDVAVEGEFPTRECVVRIDGNEKFRQSVPYRPDYFPYCGVGGTLRGRLKTPEEIERMSRLKAVPQGSDWSIQFDGVSLGRVERAKFHEGFKYKGPLGEYPQVRIQCRVWAGERGTHRSPMSTFPVWLGCDAYALMESPEGESGIPVACVPPTATTRFEVTRHDPEMRCLNNRDFRCQDP
jgi:hypothetical protein